MSSYPIVEEFYSIQGEGFHSGVAAHFVRLAGCDVRCPWCDAKESWRVEGHEVLSSEQIVDRVKASGAKSVVVTGGEPLMHDLGELTHALHEAGLQIFLESSGSRELNGEFDWICISPKRRKPPIDSTLLRASELKVVIEGEQDFAWAEECAARVGDGCMLYMQVEWSGSERVMPLVVEYVKSNPRWMVSIQTHKHMNIP
ncbi:MAG: 7-carboxy-7-deazaguanine synthase QueE [Rikenellaceae bacterium]